LRSTPVTYSGAFAVIRTAVFSAPNRLAAVIFTLVCLLAAQWVVASCTPEPVAPYAARAMIVR